MVVLLFPRDPLRPRRPDDHFTWRAEAAREAGVTVALVGEDAPLVGGIPPSASVLYQGWMVTAGDYASLVDRVVAAGGTAVTDPDAYARAHHLPGWYPTFAHLTPASAWLPATASSDDLVGAARALGDGPVIVKDWVKSRKHEWETACYAPAPEDVPRVAARMVELQGDDLTGGIVLRAFERWTGPEARVWWVEGEPVVVTAHPDTPGALARPDTEAVAPAVAALGCPFVTTDLARRDDGVWRVVEVGDGQVSDFPRTGDHATLLAALGRW